jgi:hypothetical protein
MKLDSKKGQLVLRDGKAFVRLPDGREIQVANSMQAATLLRKREG